MEIYLDNAATTKCSPAAAQLVSRVLTVDYGNPSSLHAMGLAAERYVKDAAAQIAKTLHCEEKELIFTSGGTESNNLALLGGAMANRRSGRHIITTAVEHPSVQNVMNQLEEQGFSVTRLPVNEYGEIATEDLADALRDDTILVSVMMINNEMGALEPVGEAGRLIHAKNPDILFHVDAVQAYGKFPIRPRQMDIDLLSASAHKIHGPKGVGFLYIRDRAKVRPILYGGGQQRGMRSGTINAPGIAGMGEAARVAYADLDGNVARMYNLRAHLIERLLALEDVRILGRIPDGLDDAGSPDGVSQSASPACESRSGAPDAAVETARAADGSPDGSQSGKSPAQAIAPHIVSAAFPGVKSEVLLHALEEKGIYVSAGSACASTRPSERTTLSAMGLSQEEQDSTLRFSLSVYTTRQELDYTVDALAALLPVLRRYRRR